VFAKQWTACSGKKDFRAHLAQTDNWRALLLSLLPSDHPSRLPPRFALPEPNPAEGSASKPKGALGADAPKKRRNRPKKTHRRKTGDDDKGKMASDMESEEDHPTDPDQPSPNPEDEPPAEKPLRGSKDAPTLGGRKNRPQYAESPFRQDQDSGDHDHASHAEDMEVEDQVGPSHPPQRRSLFDELRRFLADSGLGQDRQNMAVQVITVLLECAIATPPSSTESDLLTQMAGICRARIQALRPPRDGGGSPLRIDNIQSTLTRPRDGDDAGDQPPPKRLCVSVE